MTEQALAQIEARTNAASPGPWGWNSYSAVVSVPLAHAEGRAEVEGRDDAENSAVAWVPASDGDTATGRHAADAAFIEHAREDVPALLAEVRRLRVARSRTARRLLEVREDVGLMEAHADGWHEAHDRVAAERDRLRAALVDVHGAMTRWNHPLNDPRHEWGRGRTAWIERLEAALVREED